MADETRSPEAVEPDDVAFDRKGQEAIEGRTGTPATTRQAEAAPPAGPHATGPLTAEGATPGTGALPDEDRTDEVDPGVG